MDKMWLIFLFANFVLNTNSKITWQALCAPIRITMRFDKNDKMKQNNETKKFQVEQMNASVWKSLPCLASPGVALAKSNGKWDSWSVRKTIDRIISLCTLCTPFKIVTQQRASIKINFIGWV